MSALAQAWQGRSDHERRALAFAGLAVAAVLLFALVWLPLERARTRLAAELPSLRASIASLEEQAAVVRRLKAMPARAGATASGLGTLAGSPAALPGAQVAAIDERRLRLAGADVGFAQLLEWLATVQASHGLRVESARLDSLPTAGRVRAELVLTRG